MPKRKHYTADEVVGMLEDDDDVDEPMMQGSDDEFSDLEWEEEDNSEGIVIVLHNYLFIIVIVFCTFQIFLLTCQSLLPKNQFQSQITLPHL